MRKAIAICSIGILLLAGQCAGDTKYPPDNTTPETIIETETTITTATSTELTTTTKLETTRENTIKMTSLAEKTAETTISLAKDMVLIPDNSSSFVYENYKDVKKVFESAGFTNIKTEPIYDIVWGITPEESVKEVTVDGSSYYVNGQSVKKNVPVIIIYHLKKSDDPLRKNGDQSGNGAGEKNNSTKKDDSLTQGQKNAIKSAQSYLRFSNFSRQGLIEQLEYEKYTHNEAVYAADHCDANWSQQAVGCAKNYISSAAFSYSGLIEQLEYEQFTKEQAKYGASNCGADWNAEAAECAKSYLSWNSFSRADLIEQLLYEGFTQKQAEYGVKAAGY